MATVERVKCWTPPFRVSFPSVFEASSFEGSKPKYSVVGLWYPKKFDDKQKALWRAIHVELDKATKEKFKKAYKDLPPNFKKAIRDGEEKSHLEGYGAGCMFGTMSSLQRPGVIDRNKDIITDSSVLYPGCWARATVTVYAYDNKGKGVALGLHNIQKLGEGENFSGRAAADEDFGDDASEVWDDPEAGGDADEDFKDDPLG